MVNFIASFHCYFPIESICLFYTEFLEQKRTFQAAGTYANNTSIEG